MILGLYEAHLPVKNLEDSIKFYQSLELKVAWKDDDSVFFWIEEEKSWLGLWEGSEHKLPYHPSIRHIAFRVDYEFLKQSIQWLNSRGIQPVPFGNRSNVEPFVRPYQGNASVYFEDPDGNSLEFICYIEVPVHLRKITDKLSIEEWEKNSKHS